MPDLVVGRCKFGGLREDGRLGEHSGMTPEPRRSGMPLENVRLDPAATDERSVVCQSLRRTDP
jgi:hypothetical protein